MCGYSYNGDPGGEDILDHHGSCSDPNIVRNSDTADDLGVLADIYVVADDGGDIRIPPITADTAVAVDDAPFADTGLRIHDDGAEVFQMQVLTKASGADDETQPGTQPVLAAAIPEAEQLIWRGEGVLLFFTKEAQIPFDIVHLRADPPFHEFFFECHELKNMKA